MRKAFIAVVLCAGAMPLSLYSEEPDTTTNHELHEVVVEGAMQRASAKKVLYTPQKEVKNAALDANDLLLRMSISELMVDPMTKDVSTVTGQPVVIFINYVQAEAQDLQGLRPDDVKSVQYLDYPEDPRFKGVQHAVNIIAQEYEYGGYTKISHSEYINGGYSNKGTLFSKFAYRKMVYDLFGAWDYCSSNDVASSVYSTYHLPTGTINRNQVWAATDNFGYIDVPLTFRASYKTEKVQIINSVGFNFTDGWKDVRSDLTFSDVPERDYTAYSKTPNVSRSLSWRGQYFFMLPKDWSIGLYPNASYDHNNTWSNYSTDIPGDVAIVNNAREDVYYTRLDLYLNKRIDRHNVLKLSGDVSYSQNNVAYEGSTPFDSQFKQLFYAFGLAYSLSLDKVSVDADAGVSQEKINTNGKKYDDVYPYAHLSVYWSPNMRSRFSLWFQYATNTPQLSERTDNVQQSNELLWRSGNPMLDNARHVTVNCSYTFLPSNIFNLTAYASYYGLYDRAVTVYELYDGGKALLQTYRNSGDYTNARAAVNATLRLFDSKLLLQMSPCYSYMASTGYVNEHQGRFNYTAYAQYYLKQFNFSGYYSSRTKRLNSSTGSVATSRSFYSLQVGWGNSSWKLSLTAINFLRFSSRPRDSWSELHTPLYDNYLIIHNSNHSAGVFATVVYTIGYGKKIQQGNEIGSMSGAGSAIM